MGFFSKFFGAQPASKQSATEHAVIVYFKNYNSTDLSRLFALEERLERAINESGCGEFDGNEIAADGSDGTLYMYGPDAEKLFAVVNPILLTADFMKGARAILRFGPPQDGVPEREVLLV